LCPSFVVDAWRMEKPETTDLSVIIVNWNVRSLLERCLQSVTASAQHGALKCQVIVVDNASTDGSLEMVQRLFPTVQLIGSNANLGFARANNLGATRASGRYVLFLNPDTEVVANALATMVAYMDQHTDVGLLGPKLLFPDGRVQPSRRRFPTLATAFLESTIVQQWFPQNRILDRYYAHDRSDDVEQDVDWVVGACMLIRRQAWERVGTLDERFFMYSEELDWCRRLKSAGWRAVYLPSATVVHHEGQSSAQVVPARHIYFQSSKVLYFRKHHGAWAASCLRLFLLGTYVYQLCLEGLKWLLGHKRPLRRERIAAYLRVLRSGLNAQGEVRA
jgi:N-acetylglucosaminyl-diphospho-decaprenol L-rhamnosyltransferase